MNNGNVNMIIEPIQWSREWVHTYIVHSGTVHIHLT